MSKSDFSSPEANKVLLFKATTRLDSLSCIMSSVSNDNQDKKEPPKILIMELMKTAIEEKIRKRLNID